MSTEGKTDLPRRIHQTWKHRHVRWPLSECTASFRKWNPAWEYHLWTDREGEELIARELPDFLETYRSYPGGIFRADALRLALLYVYGGVYADLDVECLRPLEDLLAEIGHDNWEVLLSRDHPLHEREHWHGRAMWMNAFMIAKPRATFFRLALHRLQKEAGQRAELGQVVQATGPGLLSRVIESSPFGYRGLHIESLSWRWVHPLPNVMIDFPETPGYLRLIEDRSWREGAQVALRPGENEEADRGGSPYVVHYWWHSYVPVCRNRTMLLQHADLLLQSDAEIVERRLQKWVGLLGADFEEFGEALVAMAARRTPLECLILGAPAFHESAVSYAELATACLQGLPHMRVTVWAEAKETAEAPVRLLIVGPSDADTAVRIIREEELPPGSQILLVEGSDAMRPKVAAVCQERGFVPEDSVHAGRWRLPEEGGLETIPSNLHFFAGTEEDPTEQQARLALWRALHPSWEIHQWTAPALADWLETTYPDFLDTFLDYPTEKARLAAGSCLVLKHFGGVALLGRVAPLHSLDALQTGATAWALAVGRTDAALPPSEFLREEIFASTPEHPFWNQIAPALETALYTVAKSKAPGDFLSNRVREASHWLKKDHWPRLYAAERTLVEEDAAIPHPEPNFQARWQQLQATHPTKSLWLLPRNGHGAAVCI